MFSGITQWIQDLQTDPSGTLITLVYTAVCILGSLILVGPFIYIHKRMKAMNLINADYNAKG